MRNLVIHKNGFGKKWDSAEADSRTLLDANSNLWNDCDCFEAIIKNTTLDNCYVYLATIINSHCISTTITGKIRIENCAIQCRSIAGSARLQKSTILGESRISETAEISNSSFKNLTVGGNAKILNWQSKDGIEFDGQFGRIFSGVWERPPRIVCLELAKEIITESTDGKAFVGCKEAPINQWLKIGDRFGKMRGWTPEQVKELRLLFEEWLDTPIPQN